MRNAPRFAPRLLFPALILTLACGLAGAATDPATPFPLSVTAERGADGLELAPQLESMAALRALERVTLVGAPLSDGSAVDLELRRVHTASADGLLWVDGQPSRPLAEAQLSLWSGRVIGDPASSVFLAFSPHGSRGWIRTAGDLHHLLAQPADGESWESSRSRVVSETRLEQLDPSPNYVCEEAIEVPGRPQPSLLRNATRNSPQLLGSGPVLPIYEARVALETDWQFYDLFGDLDAAEAYALTLFAAVSDRYREQIGTILTMPYLALYTSNNDPWDSQDQGFICIDVLFEFQEAWMNGNGPVEADLNHMLSGANLGCGVAYLPGLCDPEFNFGVSGNIETVLPFPVSQGPLNWDFIVLAHELGHNFGTTHTHSYCPPIDECAPFDYWGECQEDTQCTDSGSLMSYCHLCSGGIENITTFFHPDVVPVMRSTVEASCLSLFEGVLAEDLGFALAGTNGPPAMEVDYAASTLEFSASSAPVAQPGWLVASFNASFAPTLGGTLVPFANIIQAMGPSGGAGEVFYPVPVSSSFPGGITLYSQMWFLDPGAGSGFAASNGVVFELIVP